MADDGIKGWLDKVYGADNPNQLQKTYDDWAATYDGDLAAHGYTNPAVIGSLVARYVRQEGAVLDAGSGTGVLGEVLAVIGYNDLTGIDLSPGMLEVAGKKDAYRELHQMMLGGPLDFPDDNFAAIASMGVLTVGHAPPDSFDELIRVTRTGGHMVFTITEKAYHQGGFKDKMDALASDGHWSLVEQTPAYVAVPHAPADVAYSTWAFVYQIN